MPVVIDADDIRIDGAQASQLMRFTVTGGIDSDAVRQVFDDAQGAFKDALDAADLTSYLWPPKTVQARPSTGVGGIVDWSSGAFYLATDAVS